MRSRAFLVVLTSGFLALVLVAGAFAYSRQSTGGVVHAASGVSPAMPGSATSAWLGLGTPTLSDPAVPLAKAEIFRQRNVSFASSVDSVFAAVSHPGTRTWAGRVWNDDPSPGALPVTGPTVSLDGYDHVQWTFTPDPGTGPWSAGPGPDLGPNGIYGLYVLNGWNPTPPPPQFSSVQNTPVSTGFDASRSFDTTTIPTGGGDQVVTVSVTPHALGAFWLNLNVNPNPNPGPNGPATVVTDQVSTSPLTHGETSSPLNDNAQGVQWTIQGPVVGQTYVLTVRVHVPNPGTPFSYKAQVGVNTISYALESGVGEATATTIPDPLLGGNWTFASSGAASWRQEIADASGVNFSGLAAPVLAVSVDQPSVTVRAGHNFDENVTAQPLTSLNGQINFGLSGAPDQNGNPTPPPPGFWVAAPQNLSMTLTGTDPVTAPMTIHVDNSVTPGQYTIYVQTWGLPAMQPILTPIAVTVTAALPAPNALVSHNEDVPLDAAHDSVTATETNPGSRQFQGQLSSWNAMTIPAATIGLDGYDHDRWTFTPDPGPGPYSTGAGIDLAQGQQIQLNTLYGWDPQTSQQTSQVNGVPVVTGFDVTRWFDTTTIPAGGGDQTVTVSVMPVDPSYSGGTVAIMVVASQSGAPGAAIDVSTVSTTTPPLTSFTNVNPGPEQTSWFVSNVSPDETYTLSLRIHVENPTGAPFEFKPQVHATVQEPNTQLPGVDGVTSTTVADPLLGGTWTFGAGAPSDWSRSIVEEAQVDLGGIEPPQMTASVSDPSPTVPAGWALSETLTITPFNGYTGEVGFTLCGTADPQDSSPPPDGFQQNGSNGPLDVAGPTSSSPLEIDVAPSVAPGDYTLYICLYPQGGGQPAPVPIHVTVTAAGPAADAAIWATSDVTLPASADTVDAGTPFGGQLEWYVGVSKQNGMDTGPVPVPGVTIDLPSGREDFQPPVQYPLHEGPRDVTQTDGIALPLGPIPLPGFTAGMDISRSVAGGDWSVIAGGVQTVTISVTPRTSYQGITVDLHAGDWYGAPYGTFGAAVTSGDPDATNVDQQGEDLQWNVWPAEVGQTYTLTVPITADTAGTFKPSVQVGGYISRSTTPQVGTTVSYTDHDLGGTVTFASTATTQWWLDVSRGVSVNLSGKSPGPTPPPPEVTVEGPYTTDASVPVVYSREPVTITRDTSGDCGGNKPVTAVQLTLDPAQGDRIVVPLAPTGSGELWSASVDPSGVHGYTGLTFDVTCSDNSVDTKDGGSIFIDPSGTIVDQCTQAPVEGATATLQTESAPGDFEPPLAGSFTPAVNPETTGADGAYGWDVLAGVWRVHVEAAGYQPADGPLLTIPPEVTDLTIELTPVGGCGDTTPPVIAPHATVTTTTGDYRGTTVQYTRPAATDDKDGTVPVTCAPAPGSRFPLGTTTVDCSASDTAGNDATSSFAVIVRLDVGAAFTALTADIRGSTVKNGLQQELTTKLTDAAKELGKKKPNVSQACQKLGEFDKTLATKTGKDGLTAAKASSWRAWADAIGTAVGCG